MNNFEILARIQHIIMYKKFELFIKKYEWNLYSSNIKILFLTEFHIENKFSEEYILFLDYLIKNKYVIKN